MSAYRFESGAEFLSLGVDLSCPFLQLVWEVGGSSCDRLHRTKQPLAESLSAVQRRLEYPLALLGREPLDVLLSLLALHGQQADRLLLLALLPSGPHSPQVGIQVLQGRLCLLVLLAYPFTGTLGQFQLEGGSYNNIRFTQVAASVASKH